jgi:prepilin-type N-terminal cleavage/methylation domain-containing protein
MIGFGRSDVAPARRGEVRSKLAFIRRAPSDDDQGFTLVELLIVIVILPIIVGAISFALIAVFSLQNGTANRLANSGDAQMVLATFEKDVQSAGMITTNSSIATGCGSSGIQVLGLEWPASAPTTIVTYAEVGSSSPYSLVRNFCTAGTMTSSTVSFNLSADPLPAEQLPSFTCPTLQPTCAATATSGWLSTQGVSDVTWAINETNKNSATGSFLYTLNATPRLFSSLPQNAKPGEPLYPLSLLGSSCSSLTMTGASTLTAVNSAGILLPIQIQASCPSAMTLDPGISLNGSVSGIVSNDPNTTVPGSDSYCELQSKHGATCDPAQVGPPETYPAQTDPLAAFTAPSNPTLPPGCLNLACPQGEEFSAARNLTGPNFGSAGGTYIFDQNVTISNDVTFASGTYWFKGGLSIAQANVNFGTGTYLFGSSAVTCPLNNNVATCLLKTNGGTLSTGSDGALFYVEAGAVTFNGSSQVSILGESNPADYALYGGIAIWDISTLPLSITNGAKVSATFGGIYCPNCQLTIPGGAGVSMAFVDASSLALANSGALAVG